MPIELSPAGLSAGGVVAIARHDEPLRLGTESRAAIEASAAVIDRILAGGESVYGVTTGFGSLANTPIPPSRSAELQVALVRSHAAGMGPLIEREVVRAMMALRARSLAMGFSGVRPEVVEAIIAILNAGLTPAVPEHGSLGASGDLAPLAHCAMCVIGEGACSPPTAPASRRRPRCSRPDSSPSPSGPRRGWRSSTAPTACWACSSSASTTCAAWPRWPTSRRRRRSKACWAPTGSSPTTSSACGRSSGRPQRARNLRTILDGSSIVASHREHDTRVQDAYSLRCSAAVHGAVRDAIEHAERIADRELASAIDNPMILPDGRVESCGNFHGAPLAQVADYLAIAVADLGALSERRTDRMLDATRSHGLPPFLSNDPGVNSGLMIAHYTQAAMVAENRRLATPASVDTIATSAMQEDHVSMGWGATRKLRQAIANLERILAVELTCAARAIELRAPLASAVGTAAAVRTIREDVPGIGADRWLAPELGLVSDLVESGRILGAVEAAVGPLA